MEGYPFLQWLAKFQYKMATKLADRASDIQVNVNIWIYTAEYLHKSRERVDSGFENYCQVGAEVIYLLR